MTTTLALRRILALPMVLALALAMAIAAALPASAEDPADPDPIPGVTLSVTLKGADEGDDVWQTTDGTVYLEADKDYVVEYSFTNDRAGDTVTFASEDDVVPEATEPDPDVLDTAEGSFAFTVADEAESGTITVTVEREIDGTTFETAITIDVEVVKVGAAEAFDRVDDDSDLVQQFGVATLTDGDGEPLITVTRSVAGVTGTIVVEGSSDAEPSVAEVSGAITVTLADEGSTATEVVAAINDDEGIGVVAALVDGADGSSPVTGPTTAANFELEPSEVVFAAFRADGVTIVEPTPAAAPAASAPAPAESPVTTASGSATFVDASGDTAPASVAVSGGTMTVTASGLTAAISGDRGATATAGPVAAPSGTISATITGDIPADGVVEARLFSTPRLVAAARSDGSGTLTIELPLGAPLDGGGPIPAGTHTMQLLIPTASGVVAMNVGVTVGGPVPASVPAGEGQVPTAPFAIAALLAVGATALVGRRTLVAPTA